MAIDWAAELVRLWPLLGESGAKDAEARKAIGQNVGEGLVYYSVGFAGFASGRRLYSNDFYRLLLSRRGYIEASLLVILQSLNSPALDTGPLPVRPKLYLKLRLHSRAAKAFLN